MCGATVARGVKVHVSHTKKMTKFFLPAAQSPLRYDCYAGFRYGLSTQGSLDVIFNCKATCDVTARQELARQHPNVGECDDDPSFADAAGDSCAALAGLRLPRGGVDCLAAVSARATPIPHRHSCSSAARGPARSATP